MWEDIDKMITPKYIDASIKYLTTQFNQAQLSIDRTNLDKLNQETLMAVALGLSGASANLETIHKVTLNPKYMRKEKK